MAGYSECIEAVTKAAGRDLTDREVDDVFTKAQGRIRRFQRAGMDLQSAAARAGDELGAEIRTAALIEKRNAALNLLRQQTLDARIKRHMADLKGNASKAIRAILTGVEGKGEGLADSIDANRHGIAGQLRGPLTEDLRKAGLLDVLKKRDKAFERDVAREMWRLDDPAAGEATGNKHAADAAGILHKHQERARLLQNEAGAWIGKQDHYITRQSHDMLKVRGDGSPEAYAAWRDDIAPRLDERTFDGLTDDSPAERERFLNATWQALASGLHDTATSDWLTGFKGPANLAKKVSQERTLHFKSADDWFDYNASYGKGAVVDGVLSGLDGAARNTAVMRVLGTNPEAMLGGAVDRLKIALKEASDFKNLDRLDNDWNGKILDKITGRASAAGHTTAGSVGATIRNTQALAKLGGVVLSSIPDLAVTAAALRHNGVGLFESYAHQVAALFPGKGMAHRAMLDQIAVGLDATIGGIHNRFRAEDGPLGKGAKLVENFHRWNGLTWWTDALKDGMGEMLGHNLARNGASEFGALAPRLQTTLGRYGIGPGEWDAIRAGKQKLETGKDYVLAHMMDQLPDDAVAHLVGDGLHPDADAARADLRTRVQTYLTDQVREGMTEPTAGTQVQVALGTKAGTVPGELVRGLMQFKTYALTYLQRSLGREVLRDGVDVGGLAHLIAGTTLLGYAAMTLKELAKGRQPRDPQTPGDYFSLVSAAMVQGGGLGIYGDFLFGDSNRMGGGFIGSLAGPAAGSVEDVHRVLTALRNGVKEHGWAEGARRGGVEAFQVGKNNAPFLNLFYSRIVLDYAVLYKLQDMMNPGYTRRYEQRIQKQNDQKFWLRPSQPVLPQLGRLVGAQ